MVVGDLAAVDDLLHMDGKRLFHSKRPVSYTHLDVYKRQYRMTVYNSVMELLTGVPVANTTPRPPVISSR